MGHPHDSACRQGASGCPWPDGGQPLGTEDTPALRKSTMSRASPPPPTVLWPPSVLVPPTFLPLLAWLSRGGSQSRERHLRTPPSAVSPRSARRPALCVPGGAPVTAETNPLEANILGAGTARLSAPVIYLGLEAFEAGGIGLLEVWPPGGATEGARRRGKGPGALAQLRGACSQGPGRAGEGRSSPRGTSLFLPLSCSQAQGSRESPAERGPDYKAGSRSVNGGRPPLDFGGTLGRTRVRTATSSPGSAPWGAGGWGAPGATQRGGLHAGVSACTPVAAGPSSRAPGGCEGADATRRRIIPV